MQVHAGTRMSILVLIIFDRMAGRVFDLTSNSMTPAIVATFEGGIVGE